MFVSTFTHKASFSKKLIISLECLILFLPQDFDGKLTDLKLHMLNRRSSCTALPGITESRVEELSEDEGSVEDQPSFLEVTTRGQERSHSFCGAESRRFQNFMDMGAKNQTEKIRIEKNEGTSFNAIGFERDISQNSSMTAKSGHPNC